MKIKLALLLTALLTLGGCSDTKPVEPIQSQSTTPVEVVQVEVASVDGESVDSALDKIGGGELSEYVSVSGISRQPLEYWFRYLSQFNDLMDGIVQTSIPQCKYPSSGRWIVNGTARTDRRYS